MELVNTFKCKEAECKGTIRIPLKIVKRESVLDRIKMIIVVARCPHCHKKSKIHFSWGELPQLADFIRTFFFYCDNCGTDNSDNWENFRFDHWRRSRYSYYKALTRRIIIIKCKDCGKKRKKATSKDIWDVIMKAQAEADVFEYLAHQHACPHCGSEISDKMKICSDCGLEINCDKCNAPLIRYAKFCYQCGDRVEKLIEHPIGDSSSTEQRCPACFQPFQDESHFCIICGQELICDKCGSEILEDADFCMECGDKVEKSKLK